ncbi:protein cornichon homolog 3 isoform X2 [Heterocephalus glaber]|uniref:Protein cornichon homolog 3 isoform X2 n=1 Tax=Heterocephalus glaber TaxID=10181 RepID=A0AAX6QJE5_HETGA|nr:protein cornichon homolog 3 isoform X2 [Heterocephalus glaber]
MAFTFAAFCYMLALVLCAALIFFAIWHVTVQFPRLSPASLARPRFRSETARLTALICLLSLEKGNCSRTDFRVHVCVGVGCTVVIISTKTWESCSVSAACRLCPASVPWARWLRSINTLAPGHAWPRPWPSPACPASLGWPTGDARSCAASRSAGRAEVAADQRPCGSASATHAHGDSQELLGGHFLPRV